MVRPRARQGPTGEGATGESTVRSAGITRRSWKDLGKGRTDYARIDKLTDAQIDAAELVLPERKEAISLRIDADVPRWFKAQGPGHLSRMNAALRQYAEAHGAAVAGRSMRARRPAT